MPRTRQGLEEVFSHPLSYVRHQHGWSLHQLVTLISHAMGGKPSTHRQKAWRWENRGVVPEEQTQLALARLLGVPPHQVYALGWPYWLPMGKQIPTDKPWTAQATMALLQDTRHALTDRRGFLTLAPGIAAALADQWLTVDSPRLEAARRGDRVTTAVIDDLHGRIAGLRRTDQTLGGGAIRHLADAELRLVTDLLAHGSYSTHTARRLYRVASELAHLAAWASFDAGYHAAAERYWNAAVRAAHTAADQGLGANALKALSLQRLDAGRPREALAIARAAVEGAPDASPRVRAMLLVRQARAHAALRDAVSCEHLLSQAETAMARADDHPDPDPSWAAYFDTAEYAAQVAACYRDLGRPRHTDRWLRTSLQTQPDQRSRDRATYLIWYAETILDIDADGAVQYACQLASRAVGDIAVAHSARNTARLLALHRRLRRYRVPEVEALNTQVHELIA